MSAPHPQPRPPQSAETSIFAPASSAFSPTMQPTFNTPGSGVLSSGGVPGAGRGQYMYSSNISNSSALLLSPPSALVNTSSSSANPPAAYPAFYGSIGSPIVPPTGMMGSTAPAPAPAPATSAGGDAPPPSAPTRTSLDMLSLSGPFLYSASAANMAGAANNGHSPSIEDFVVEQAAASYPTAAANHNNPRVSLDKSSTQQQQQQQGPSADERTAFLQKRRRFRSDSDASNSDAKTNPPDDPAVQSFHLHQRLRKARRNTMICSALFVLFFLCALVSTFLLVCLRAPVVWVDPVEIPLPSLIPAQNVFSLYTTVQIYNPSYISKQTVVDVSLKATLWSGIPGCEDVCGYPFPSGIVSGVGGDFSAPARDYGQQTLQSTWNVQAFQSHDEVQQVLNSNQYIIQIAGTVVTSHIFFSQSVTINKMQGFGAVSAVPIPSPATNGSVCPCQQTNF